MQDGRVGGGRGGATAKDCMLDAELFCSAPSRCVRIRTASIVTGRLHTKFGLLKTCGSHSSN